MRPLATSNRMVTVVGLAMALATTEEALALSPQSPQTTPAATYDAKVRYEGRNRWYRVHAPGYVGAEPQRPLVLALHGAESTGPQMEKITAFDAVADAFGAVVVYPTGTWRYGTVCCEWSDSRPLYDGAGDVEVLDLVIEAVSARHRIDPSRIYVAGLSNGGFMALRLACERSETYAAFAVVAAAMTDAQLANGCSATPKRILLINGDADIFVPYLGGPMIWTPGAATEIGVPATRNMFARQYGCEPMWTSTHVDHDPLDGTGVTKWVAAPCHGQAVDVKLFRITGGGHTWPNERSPDWWPLVAGLVSREFDGATKIMNWFSSH